MLPPSPDDAAIDGSRELGGFAPGIVRADGRMHGAPLGRRRLAFRNHPELARERFRIADRKVPIARQRQRQVGRDSAGEQRHFVDRGFEQRDRVPFAGGGKHEHPGMRVELVQRRAALVSREHDRRVARAAGARISGGRRVPDYFPGSTVARAFSWASATSTMSL